MQKIWIKSKIKIVRGGHFQYTVNKGKKALADTCNRRSICLNEDAGREEIFNMTEMTQKLNSIQLPPHVMRELGLETNWQRKVSPEFIEKIVGIAEKYKGALRRLSKY